MFDLKVKVCVAYQDWKRLFDGGFIYLIHPIPTFPKPGARDRWNALGVQK